MSGCSDIESEQTPLVTLNGSNHTCKVIVDHVICNPSNQCSLNGNGDVRSNDPTEVSNKDLLENWQISMHIIKASIGTGILGLPLSLNLAGLVVGPIILFVMGLASIHCMQLLTVCSQEVTKRSSIERLDYGELAQLLVTANFPKYAKLARVIVNVLLCLLQLGLCCVYLQFVADNFCQKPLLCAQKNAQIFSDSLSVRWWTTILLPFVVVPSMIKSLRILAYVSLLSNVFAMTGLIGVLQYLVFNIHEVSHYHIWGGFSKFFIFFGQAVFAFQSISVVLPVEIKARKREDFIKVMSISMVAVIVLYLAVAVLGFMAFGGQALGSITLNLPTTPFYQAVRVFYALAIYLTYFLQFYVPVSIITPVIKQRWGGRKGQLLTYGARVFLVLLTYAASISTSALGDSIALVGSVAGSAVLFIIPSTLHIISLWPKLSERTNRVSLIKDLILIFVGVAGALAGTYESILDMVVGS